MRIFREVSVFHALVRGEPPQPRDEILSRKTCVLMAIHSEDFVILACTVLIGLKGVTDGRTRCVRRTDGRTDERTDRHLDNG